MVKVVPPNVGRTVGEGFEEGVEVVVLMGTEDKSLWSVFVVEKDDVDPLPVVVEELRETIMSITIDQSQNQ